MVKSSPEAAMRPLKNLRMANDDRNRTVPVTVTGENNYETLSQLCQEVAVTHQLFQQ